ncbi:hypothetical protein M7I_5670 [Glarea lozoyensis 74030]|uniref:DUF7587 domain-containing protein n=1 Tax=Glarea lozoyensis (strain ATCC 74030 / MF5533) TaxID=1104152 RepID=H0ESI1_GLAL7|nr:hypothetical protein M7I_5670 [Glarea lozoyensis 74030]
MVLFDFCREQDEHGLPLFEAERDNGSSGPRRSLPTNRDIYPVEVVEWNQARNTRQTRYIQQTKELRSVQRDDALWVYSKRNVLAYGAQNVRVAIVSVPALDKLRIPWDRSSDLVRSVGGSPWSKYNESGVKYASKKHYLVYGWVPPACIIKTFTFQEFTQRYQPKTTAISPSALLSTPARDEVESFIAICTSGVKTLETAMEFYQKPGAYEDKSGLEEVEREFTKVLKSVTSALNDIYVKIVDKGLEEPMDVAKPATWGERNKWKPSSVAGSESQPSAVRSLAAPIKVVFAEDIDDEPAAE